MTATKLTRRLRLPLHDWQKKLLDERLAEADRNPGAWVPAEEVEQEISAALVARLDPM